MMTSEQPAPTEFIFLENMKQQFKEIAADPNYAPTQDVREVVDHLFLLGFRESEVVDILMTLRYNSCSGEPLDSKMRTRAFVQRIKPNMTVGRQEERFEWVYHDDGIGPPDTPYVNELLEIMKKIEDRQREAEYMLVDLYTSGSDIKTICKILNGNFDDLVEAHHVKASPRRVENYVNGWPNERFFWSLREDDSG